MFAHLFSCGVRALAISIVGGGLMIYATGGLTSPHATSLVGVSIAAFLIFWIMFATILAKRAPAGNAKADVGSTDGGGYVRQRGHRRERDEFDNAGDGGNGDGGGGGGD